MAEIIFDGGSAASPGSQSIQLGADTCTQVLNLASQLLQDATSIQWSITDKMLPYMNLGIKELVNIKPEAYSRIFNAPLAGGPRQLLPPGALFIVDVESVLDLNNKPSSAVTLVDRVMMDRLLPGWLSISSGDIVQYVIKDQRNPEYFYVVPPPPVNTVQSAALVCACYPVEVTALQVGNVDVPFPLMNKYVPAIVNYIVSCCLIEETTIPNAQQKAIVFRQNFYNSLGVTISSKAKSDAQDV